MIKWLTFEENPQRRQTSYPRIGGGRRVKDLGYNGSDATLIGTTTATGKKDIEEDYTKAREYVTRGKTWTIRVPLGGGARRKLRLYVTDGRLVPRGAGIHEIRLSVIVLDDEGTQLSTVSAVT